VSVKRKYLIKYLEENGFYLLREGGNNSIYTNNIKTLPVKRYRITANAICNQADLFPNF